MTTILIIVAVVAVAAIAYFILRRSGEAKQLPREPGGEAARPEPERAPAPSKKAEPAKAAPADAGQPATARADDDSGARASVKVVTPVAVVSEPVRKAAASAEDIAALRKGLASTRGGFIARLARIFGGRTEIDPKLLDEIEEVLITADVGVQTTAKILGRLRERMGRNELSDPGRIWDAIRDESRAILADSGKPLSLTKRPSVILVVGVNGVGKTTTIGKLASRFTQEGKKVVLAAGDTFRAAAVLQLEVWGRRTGCPIVKGKDSADPGSVIFDAIRRAKDEGADVVIADTAGRLHTKAPLMEELKKLGRTVEKALDRPADEILLVLDSTNGQNAIAQAQMFREALAVTGIVLTKLDGTAKGGVILGIVDEQKVPVRFIGIGEKVEDLREFDAPSFVEALFAKPEEAAAAS